MEIVLCTQIIDGEPGSPKVEASYFWQLAPVSVTMRKLRDVAEVTGGFPDAKA